jgi:hypothetical protein
VDHYCAEENRENFCKVLDGKPLFTALYDMCTVTLNELKAILRVNAQAGQIETVNKTSLESTAQIDDFQEVKRRKRHITNDTSQTTKKSTKSVPICTAVRLPPKAMSIRSFFTPLRNTDMDTKTGAQNALPEQEASRKSSRPPLTMTATTNLIRLQINLRKYAKGEYESRNTRNGTRYITKDKADYSAIKSYMEKNNLHYFFSPNSERL